MGDGPIAHRHIFGENLRRPVHDYLGALDVAAVSLRSIDGPRLAPFHPAGFGEHYCDGGCFVDKKLKIEK
jgi:hypothetical protein